MPQTSSPQPPQTAYPPYPPYDDEIDLIELVRTVWRGRWVLIAFIVLGVILAGIYAFTAKQQWTSVARVSAPQVEQIGDYLSQRRLLARIDRSGSVSAGDVQDALLTAFVAQVTTSKDQSGYLKTTPYYEKLVQRKGIEKDDLLKQRLLNQLVEKNLQVKAPEQKAVAQYYGISFSAETPSEAQQTLTGLLKYMGGKAAGVVDGSFRSSVTDAIRARELKVSTVEVKTKAERNAMIDTYQMALKTANEAGIKDYAAAGQVDKATVIELGNNNRLFLLGSKYLTAELNTARTSPLVFPADYYVTQRELEELRPLGEYKVTVPSYFVQQPPTLPVKRDSPKRSLILALGFVLGGLVGVLWIFGAQAVRREREKAQAAAQSQE